jgi:ER protein Pkr1
MSSFIAQVMEPGGGLMLLPFVRFVIGCLLCLTIVAAIFDVARIHMIILSILSSGLFISLHWFENEFKKVRNGNSNHGTSSMTNTTSDKGNTTSNSNKTD